MVKIILNGTSAAQIYLGFGRKFLSVGVCQNNSSMDDDRIDEICEEF
jgi:hypothetical protein